LGRIALEVKRQAKASARVVRCPVDGKIMSASGMDAEEIRIRFA